MDEQRKQLLRPRQAVAFLEGHGVKVTTSTLSTWRSREPERVPFRRILGRIYYEEAVLEALVGGDAAEGR